MYPFCKGSCSVQNMCMHAKGVFFVCLVFFYHRLESTGCKNIYKIFFALLTIFKLSFLLSTK